MAVVLFLLVSCWLQCTVSLERINVVFKQVGSFPSPCPAQTDLSCPDTPEGAVSDGVRMRPQESLRNLLYTQAASVQSEEHPKQLLRVSDKNMQPHNKKVIPSITMKKKELKERNPPEMNK